ncbi:MAG: M23 family peptidase [Alphaproteobacteria bacterium]|nr:M23 family peptidase [Alphaproteobacteria bacterium]
MAATLLALAVCLIAVAPPPGIEIATIDVAPTELAEKTGRAVSEDLVPLLAGAIAAVEDNEAPTVVPPFLVQPRLEQTVVTVPLRKGGTLIETLLSAGADREDAEAAVASLREIYDPRKLRAGQEIVLTLAERRDAGGGGPQLLAVALQPSVEQQVLTGRRPDGSFATYEVQKSLSIGDERAHGVIDASLYEAAEAAGLPPTIIMELIRLLSWDVDFQRDVQPGDDFEVLYERHFDDSGEPVKDGAIHYAAMTIGGKRLAYYRFALPDGTADYYDRNGLSVRKPLLRTPLDGARITSGFGNRRHPILGYTKMHRGVDFGAPSGTPVMAAGDGVVEEAGWNGSYGRYVRVRHTDEYKTAYGHLSRFAAKLRAGSRVRQGDVIGYVGSSGRSTGPHLHYEVQWDGKQVNPIAVKLPTGSKLAGAELARFKAHLAALTQRLYAVRLDSEVAGL